MLLKYLCYIIININYTHVINYFAVIILRESLVISFIFAVYGESYDSKSDGCRIEKLFSEFGKQCCFLLKSKTIHFNEIEYLLFHCCVSIKFIFEYFVRFVG